MRIFVFFSVLAVSLAQRIPTMLSQNAQIGPANLQNIHGSGPLQLGPSMNGQIAIEPPQPVVTIDQMTQSGPFPQMSSGPMMEEAANINGPFNSVSGNAQLIVRQHPSIPGQSSLIGPFNSNNKAPLSQQVSGQVPQPSAQPLPMMQSSSISNRANVFPTRNQPNFIRQNPLPCGFSCSRKTTVMMSLDGEFSSAACSDKNADPNTRCHNCCASVAFANEIDKTWASGFVSTNGKDCICCTNKQKC